MTDRIRAASTDLLSMHDESVSFVAAQHDLMRKSVLTAFELGRASLDASADLQRKMMKNWTDAMVPAAPAAAKA